MSIYKTGNKYFSNSNLDGGIRFTVFSASEVDAMTDTQIIMLLEWYSIYSGPGGYFANDAYVIRKGSRVLVKQHWGYDI